MSCRGHELAGGRHLANIIRNALDLSARADGSSLAAAAVHLPKSEVRDTAVGIPSDKLPIIFQALHQLEFDPCRLVAGPAPNLSDCKCDCVSIE